MISSKRRGVGSRPRVWRRGSAQPRRFSAETVTVPSRVWRETGVGIWALMREMEQGFNIASWFVCDRTVVGPAIAVTECCQCMAVMLERSTGDSSPTGTLLVPSHSFSNPSRAIPDKGFWSDSEYPRRSPQVYAGSHQAFQKAPQDFWRFRHLATLLRDELL